MPTIEKTIEVPENRRLEIDLPDDMPTGSVKMVLTLLPSTAEELPMSEAELEARRKVIRSAAGIFKDNPAFARGGPAIQRELRDEWD